MDALKSVRVESTQQHQVSQGEPLEIAQSATEEGGVVANSTSDEPENVIQKCSKKHLREGEY